MNCIFIFTIFTVGLSGIMAQVLFLRELLVGFYGNELALGLVLANWLALEALGAFVLGRFIDRTKGKSFSFAKPMETHGLLRRNYSDREYSCEAGPKASSGLRSRINIFIALELVFSLMLPVSIYLCRDFKGILGIPFGEALGLNTIFFWSFLVLMPISFVHGALFSASCKIYSLYSSSPSSSIGRVYAWETFGAVIGAVILTYLFIPYLNSFQTAFLIIIVNLIICLLLLKLAQKTRLNYIILTGLAAAILFLFSGGVNKIDRISVDRQYKGRDVLAYRNSVYGNITVTKQLKELTFFYNGIPVITTPFADRQFVEDFGHLPLLFHNAPKDVLVVSAGAGGLLAEIIKHPVEKINYCELDPLILSMLRRFPTELTDLELRNSRLNIINLDGRFYLKANQKTYDVIMVGLSNQSDLATNRLFTKEFFALAKKRLNPEGIFALWMPGSLTYMAQELRDLNASVLNGLKEVFSFVRVIPGDYNIFLASSSSGIMDASWVLISQRLSERNIKTNLLNSSYLEYRLDRRWLDWFRKNSQGATKKVNLDLKPAAVFQALKFSNRKFFPSLVNTLKIFESLSLRKVFIFLSVITIFLLYLSKRLGSKNLKLAYSIATTGFFGMLSSLILIFGFQIIYGYLYQWIGLLISLSMAGIMCGSLLIASKINEAGAGTKLFIGLEALIIIFSFVMAPAISGLKGMAHNAMFYFIALFFISGLLVGIEFPLAAKLYLRKNKAVGEATGALYASDLLGGWLAGILGGIVLVPILGIFDTCMVMAMLKISSIILLTLPTPSHPSHLPSHLRGATMLRRLSHLVGGKVGGKGGKGLGLDI